MNATTFTTTGDDYTLVLDAKFDLAQAGRNSSDIHVMAFERGYRRAAELEMNGVSYHWDLTVV